MRFAAITVLFLGVASSKASLFYASPIAGANGTGTISNPWTIQAGFVGVRSGDTLYLRGGDYYIGAIISQMNNVTVLSYPREWAHVHGGLGGTLGTVLGPTGPSSTNIMIQGSETWQPAMVVSIGGEVFQLSATTTTATNWNVNRAWDDTVQVAHTNGSPVCLFSQMIIDHTGTNCVFRDFEMSSLMTTNRRADYSFYAGGGLNFHGSQNSAINMVIHDVGHPGIGFWDQYNGGEINGCLLYANGVYDFATFGGAPRGDAVYAQNSTGTALFKGNIIFRNLTYGLDCFGETGPVTGFRLQNNISFNQGVITLSFQSGSTPMTNDVMWTNFLVGAIGAGYVSYTNRGQDVIGNVLVNSALTLRDAVSGTYSNNTLFVSSNSTATDNSSVSFNSQNSASNNQLAGMAWDYNTYYFFSLAPPAHPHQFAFWTKNGQAIASDNSGHLLWDNDAGKSWREVTGWDAHSTISSNWPNNYLLVHSMPLDYNPNRHHVVVISTSGATTAALDLSTNGFGGGDHYELRDAQNYFTVIASGTYTSGTISLPLNLTTISTLSGSVTNFTPTHTDLTADAGFNVFVLDRTVQGSTIIGKATTAGKVIIQ